MQSKHRQLLLSVTITALILSTTLVFQTASATTVGGYIQKSLTMAAGTDGRSFALINGTYSFPATQRVDYNNSFTLYRISWDNSYATTSYSLPSPTLTQPTSAFDPTLFSTGPLSSSIKLSKFLMTHNTTNNVVSPTITLSARDNITLGFGTTSEAQVDVSNVVIATLAVSSNEVNHMLALTGLVSGATVTINIYDASGNSLITGSAPAGYFAFPFLANVQGVYAFYMTSTASSYIKVTPTVVQTTDLTLGQFTSGEIKIPDQPVNSNLNQNDYQPSQIVALSYSVSTGDDYAYSFTMTEELSSGSSPYTCYYYNAGQRGDGTPYWGVLSSTGTSTVEPLASEAPASGKVYIILVASYVSRFLYSMGVESATVLQAPLNQVFPVSLPTPYGLHRQLYKFNLPAESMVRMNYTSYSGTMYSTIFKLTPSGNVYPTSRVTLSSGSSWIRSGSAETNYAYSLYMSEGSYLLAFDTSGTSSAQIEINTYPITNYTDSSAVSISAHTTRALAFNITSSFQWYAFNITLTSQLNASMVYRITIFDDYNRYLSMYSADGSSANRGLGNKEASGIWQGVASGSYNVDPGPATTLYFNGNKTSQVAAFVAPYAGRYFVILDFLNGYDTTTQGNNNANRWIFYTNPVSLNISVSKPNLATLGYVDMKTVNLDSSSGTGSTTVVLTAAGQNMISLSLTTKLYSWTRISVSIVNGTRSTYEELFDRVRCPLYGGGPYYAFDYSETQHLWPVYSQVANSFGYQNTTYSIEFGALMQTMGIVFSINVPGGAAHTLVSINVQHYTTPGFSGLSAMVGTALGGGVPTVVVVGIVVAVIVVMAIVIIYVVLKKRK